MRRDEEGDAAPDKAPDLARCEGRCWEELAAGAADRHHPFHLGVLSTIGLDGRPRSRTVVLRHADAGVILCHSDARSPTVAEIEANPAVAWVFYDPLQRVQLRVQGTARVHRGCEGDPLALDRWQRSSRSSRRCYLAPRPPGEECDAPSANLPEELLGRIPLDGEDAPGLANFAAIATAAIEIDRLELRACGHWRARLRLGAARSSRWVEP